MILIITTNEVNQTHEGQLVNNPPRNKYAMFSIIIPRKPHLLLPFNSTNTNLWLGTRIINRDWGTIKGTNIRKTCKKYMSDNMYQKMDPIKDIYDQLVSPSIQRKLNVIFKFTIKDSAKTYLPAAFIQSK